MNRLLRFLPLLASSFLLTGCPYDNPPSGPSRNIDTWLVGQWMTQDKSGHCYKAVIAPVPSAPSHYRISMTQDGKTTDGYDAWLSRVDDFSILVVKLPEGGKYALFHHELLAPGTPPPGGIGATRIRLSELQLDPSAASLDSFHLRRAIREALKAGTLLAPYDVMAERKEEAAEEAAVPRSLDLEKPPMNSSATNSATTTEVPGSVIWTRTGDVTLKGETF